MDGMEVLRKLHALDETLPVVMISGHGTTATAVDAIRSGATDFLDKPLSSERVIVTLRNALTQSELRTENRELRLAMESRYEIVGQSPALRQVLEAVKRAAPTNATVMLLGESGVGKELVARTIHRNSPRNGQRFVQVNCAAIPEELIESELFGHEKGSFTGATEKQIGKFEQADRGSIFLDEVGDMSPKTQAKVLRVLQEQEVERLGSARTIKVDVRVISATNKNLDEAIQRGEFREDLFFRLNVIPITVPPLRDRREDIPALVQHFARRSSEEHNLKPRKFDASAMEVLQRYRWRGNIRELRNAVERMLIMAPNDVIRADDLPREYSSGANTAVTASAPRLAPAATDQSGGSAPETREAEAPATGGTLREFKDAAERAYLVQKLRENVWNISKTAEVIDTPRSNLYKKLEQYRISQETDG
jgi:two-component system nitrogen regulation response regulator NtrX